MSYFATFIAGFVSTLVFHQGALAILHAAGLTSRLPYAMAATWPFHIPAVISLALWGGVWAIALCYVINRSLARSTYWAAWIAFGATLPTLVALYVVFPLKGMPAAAEWSPEVVGTALLLNAAWGLGVALLLKWLKRLPRQPLRGVRTQR